MANRSSRQHQARLPVSPLELTLLILIMVLSTNRIMHAAEWYVSPFGIRIGSDVKTSGNGSAIVTATHYWEPKVDKSIEFRDGFWRMSISSDGLVSGTEDNDGTWTPYFWTEADGYGRIDIPFGSRWGGSAFDLSSDGTVIVGSLNREPISPYRWSSEDGMTQIPFPPEFTNAHGGLISGDGHVVAGFGWRQPGTGWRAYRWSAEDGSSDLGALSSNQWYMPRDISYDGSVIVGEGFENVDFERQSREAFLWTADEAMMGLGTLPGREQSMAQAVSDDGKLVLGESYAAGSTLRELPRELFVWSEAGGMQDLSEILARELQMELPGMLTVKDISADQTTIVGYGDYLSAEHERQVWVAVLDRPLSELLSSGLVGDFNGDGAVDASDINLLSEAIRDGSADAKFDLDGSNTLEFNDLSTLIHDQLSTWFGDANLDGEFNSSDLVSVFEAGLYEDGIDSNARWESGDWNGDSDFNTSDLVLAFQDGGYEQGPRAATKAVPEPTFAVNVLLALLAVLVAKQRRQI